MAPSRLEKILGSAAPGPHLGHDMGGCKTYGGGKRTEQRTLQKISGPLEKSVWSGQSSTFYREKKSSDTRGGWKTYQTKGVQNHFLEGVSFVRFSSPPPFSTPPMASSDPCHRAKNGTHSTSFCDTRGHTPIELLP